MPLLSRAGAVAIGIGRTDVEEVDRLNIYWAAMVARRRSVGRGLIYDTGSYPGRWQAQDCGLSRFADAVGRWRCTYYSASIAAASIVAKVTRDSIMDEYTQLYPGYGFERHKRDGTADHISALGRLGPLPLHRWSFAPVWRAGRVQPQLVLWDVSGKAGTD